MKYQKGVLIMNLWFKNKRTENTEEKLRSLDVLEKELFIEKKPVVETKNSIEETKEPMALLNGAIKNTEKTESFTDLKTLTEMFRSLRFFRFKAENKMPERKPWVSILVVFPGQSLEEAKSEYIKIQKEKNNYYNWDSVDVLECKIHTTESTMIYYQKTMHMKHAV